MSSRTRTSGSKADSDRTLLRVLTSLARSPESLSVDDVTAEHDLTPAAVQRALRTLTDEGFAAVDPGSGHYAVGLKFIQLARISRVEHLLEREIRPVLRGLAQEAGETVTFNTYAPGATSALCMLVEESPAPLHYAVEVGERKALHAGASGKAILAQLSDEAIDAYIAQTGLPPVTARTITEADALWREVRRIRKQGYATSRGQRLEGAVAVACPVFDGAEVHGSIVLTIPAHRLHADALDGLVELVRNAAAQVTDLVGAQSRK